MNRDYLMFRRTAIFKRNKTWVGIVKLKENWKHRLYIYNAVEFTGYANSNSNNTKNMDKTRLYLLNSSFTHYCWRHRNRKGDWIRTKHLQRFTILTKKFSKSVHLLTIPLLFVILVCFDSMKTMSFERFFTN